MRWCHIVLAVAIISPVRARIGTFWHVTDFHYDVNYTTNGDNTNICWPNSDLNDPDKMAGRFGDFECDAPRSLLEAAVRGMAEIYPNPDFVMWTGDYTAHVPLEYFSTENVGWIIGNLTAILKESFPSTPFVPLLGNHDYHPKDQVPPGQTEMQTKVAEMWRSWLPGEEYETFLKHGRFTRDLPNSKITIVVINTLQWYHNNQVAGAIEGDVGGHFHWADDVLSKLKDQGRRVFLVGHIPAQGIFFKKMSTSYQDRVNKKFIKLVRDHADVIEAQFFAHQHTDSFRLVYSEDGEVPVSYQLVAPAVTPWPAHNPAIRLISFDTDTGKLTELSTYYLDLKEANKMNKAEWRFEYNFTSEYNLPEISPASLNSLVKRMQDNDAVFDRYYRLNTVSLAGPGECTDECRQLYLCAITKLDYTAMRECSEGSGAAPRAGWVAGIMAALLLLTTMC